MKNNVNFTGRVGASDLGGDVKVETAGRLNVEADLMSRRLDLDDLTAILGARTRTTASGENTTTVSSGEPGKLLPDATLQVERLRTMDGRVAYRADQVKANDLDVRKVNLGGVLKEKDTLGWLKGQGASEEVLDTVRVRSPTTSSGTAAR